jgi:hypothetical protein
MKNLPKGTVCRQARAFLHGSRDHVPMRSAFDVAHRPHPIYLADIDQ